MSSALIGELIVTEIARNLKRINRLVLIGPVGLDRQARQARHPRRCSPCRARSPMVAASTIPPTTQWTCSKLPDDQLHIVARNRDLALLTWEPCTCTIQAQASPARDHADAVPGEVTASCPPTVSSAARSPNARTDTIA
jgi:hypothetical protein